MGIALFLLTLLAPALGQIKVVGNCKCDPTVSRSQSVKCSFSDGKLHTASTSEQPIQHGLEVRFHPAERANPRAPVPVGARPVATFCRLLRLPLRPAASPALPLRTTPGPRLTLPPYPCISRPPSGRVPAAQFKCIASGTHDGANCECCDCGISAAQAENGVLVLTEENFDDVINSYGRLFIHYYSPWCVHCQELAVEFERTAEQLANTEPPMRLAKVDVTREPALASRAGVDERWTAVWAGNIYADEPSGGALAPVGAEEPDPTLKLYKLGRVATDYTGEGQTQKAFVTWLAQNGNHPCQYLRTYGEARRTLEGMDVAVLGYFPASDESAQLQRRLFCQVALAYPHLSFVLLNAKNVARKLDVKAAGTDLSSPGLAVFKHARMTARLEEGDFHSEDLLKEFAERHAIVHFPPHVLEWSHEAAADINDSPIMRHLLVFGDRTSPHFEAALRVMAVVAKQFEGAILTIFMHAPDQARTMKALDIRLAHPDEFHPVLHERKRNLIRDWADWGTEFTPKGLRLFVEEYLVAMDESGPNGDGTATGTAVENGRQTPDASAVPSHKSTSHLPGDEEDSQATAAMAEQAAAQKRAEAEKAAREEEAAEAAAAAEAAEAEAKRKEKKERKAAKKKKKAAAKAKLMAEKKAKDEARREREARERATAAEVERMASYQKVRNRNVLFAIGVFFVVCVAGYFATATKASGAAANATGGKQGAKDGKHGKSTTDKSQNNTGNGKSQSKKEKGGKGATSSKQQDAKKDKAESAAERKAARAAENKAREEAKRAAAAEKKAALLERQRQEAAEMERLLAEEDAAREAKAAQAKKKHADEMKRLEELRLQKQQQERALKAEKAGMAATKAQKAAKADDKATQKLAEAEAQKKKAEMAEVAKAQAAAAKAAEAAEKEKARLDQLQVSQRACLLRREAQKRRRAVCLPYLIICALTAYDDLLCSRS